MRVFNENYIYLTDKSSLEAEEIEEGNKLISDFLERYPKDVLISDYEDPIVLTINYDSFSGAETSRITRPFGYSDLQYHCNWNWLMPVVSKIFEKTTLGISLSHKIEEQYRVVVSYIKYYNNLNKL